RLEVHKLGLERIKETLPELIAALKKTPDDKLEFRHFSGRLGASGSARVRRELAQRRTARRRRDTTETEAGRRE
ncbi:MAG: hypothetical protein ACYSWU_12320, partial [Planctomycetota bacterium]